MTNKNGNSTSSNSSVSTNTDRPFLGIIFAFGTTIVGSSAAATSKFIANEVPVTSIILIQYTIGLMVLMPWIFRQSRASLSTQHFKTHLLRGIAGWLCFYTFYLALPHIPLVDASLLRHTAPLLVPLVAWLWVRAKVPRSRLLPMVIGFLGIALILRPSSSPGIWHLIGLVSGLTLAASMVGTRVLSHYDSSSKILFYYNAISVVCSLPLGIAYWEPIPVHTWPYIAYIGGSVFIAMWLYTKAYGYAKASSVAPIGYFSVVNAGILGWLIWDHLPDNIAMIGIGVVIFAGLLTVFLTAKEEKQTGR